MPRMGESSDLPVLRSRPGWRDVNIHSQASGGDHINQCVDGEEPDLAAYQIRDSRLRYTHDSGRARLGDFSLLDIAGQSHHHLGADAEVFRFGGRKSAV